MRFYVKVIPGASLNRIEEISSGNFKIHLRAEPKKNQANLALVDLLAERFKKPKNQIKIISGKTAKIKLVEIF